MNNKKILKKFLSFILSFVLIFTASHFLPMITAFAESINSGELVDGVYYKVINNEAVVTGCSTSNKEIIIKSEYDGYPVTKIIDKAFYNGSKVVDKRYTPFLRYYRSIPSIENITIPKTIRHIGKEAFQGCGKLKKVIIEDISLWNTIVFEDIYSNPLYYEKYNYLHTYFSTLNGTFVSKIEESVKSTSLFLLDGESSEPIREIIVNWNCESISNFAFSGCQSIETVILNNGVKVIGKYAFYNCFAIKNVKISNSVAEVCDLAFYGCTKIASLILPNDLSGISDTAFSNSLAYGRTKKCIWYIGENVLSVSGNGSMDNYNKGEHPWNYEISEVKINPGITSIGAYNFYNCKSLSKITIPDSVDSIDSTAFYECDKDKLVIYTDSTKSAAFNYAKDNGYSFVAPFDSTRDVVFFINDNTLRIFGTGKTPNYNLFTSTPWYDFKDNITKIIIDKSITEIGTYSFYGFDNLKIIETENPNLKFNTRSINTGNKNISVYSTGSGTLEEYCNNNSVNFVKPPETPVLKTVTEDTIEVENGNGYEYSLDKINWQESEIFKELKPVTQYKVYVRRKNGHTPFEGKPLVVTTTKRIIAAPVSPTMEGYAANSVTLKPGYEYSLDGINWQHSNVFDNLLLNKIYTLYQRTIENDTDFCSKSSEALYFSLPDKPEIIKIGATTLAAKEIEGYEYSLDKINWQSSAVFTGLINNMKYTVYQRISKSLYPNSYQIASAGTEVYVNGNDKIVPKAPQAPIIDNLTNNAVLLKAMPNYEYKMDNGEWQSNNVFTGLAPNSTHKFYQRIAGTDTAYASESSEALTVTTLKNTVNAPSAPTVLSKTTNSVTLKGTSGYEYSTDGRVWQKSNVFTGLNEDTEYTFYQRIAETETAYASESSAPLKVRTDKSYTPGDLDGDEKITDKDAIYLLMHSYFPDDYPVNQPLDYNNDGLINDKDAIYLLMHCYFPEDYPITK